MPSSAFDHEFPLLGGTCRCQAKRIGPRKFSVKGVLAYGAGTVKLGFRGVFELGAAVVLPKDIPNALVAAIVGMMGGRKQEDPQ
jgi:hypothetical protein